MQTEEWRDVVGFPDYSVSSLGRVISYKRAQAPLEMAQSVNGQWGYRMVGLSRGGARSGLTVHSIVAAAFLGPRPEGMEVLHCDGDKSNNAATNLRYGSRSDNEQDKVRHGAHNEARKTQCPSGHAYDDANTHYYAGKRYCRACRRKWQRARLVRLQELPRA